MRSEPCTPEFETATDFPSSLKTRLHDMMGRKWLVRTFVGAREQGLVALFEKQVAVFVEEVELGKTGFTEKQMKDNARGPHFFSIMGHDRNNKKVRPFLLHTPRLVLNSFPRCPLFHFGTERTKPPSTG